MKHPIIILMLAALFSLGGCASFTAYETPRTNLRPVSGLVSDTPLRYNFTLTSADKRTTEQNLQAAEIPLEGHFKNVIQKSKYFRSIDWGDNKNDLFLDVSLFIDARPTAAALLTAASLTAIPSWQSNKFTLKCKVKIKSKEIQSYVFNDRSTDVTWLPFVIFPIGLSSEFDPYQTPNVIIDNLFMTLANRLLDDGLINFIPDA